MDTRRFLTETKTALVEFLDYWLNDPEFADLWAKVGGGIDVTVVRPGWRQRGALAKPLVAIRKAMGETEYTTTSTGQYLVEGYWKVLFLELLFLTDEETGGRITCDDLASSCEVIIAKYRDTLQAEGIVPWDLSDAAEMDELAEYENRATLQCGVLVPGKQIQPMKIELGRILMLAPGQGQFYSGETLDPAMFIEGETITATVTTDLDLEVWCVNQDDQTVVLDLHVPRATAAGTRIALTGGDPTDTYKQVLSMDPTGGQAGYTVGIFTKQGA